MCFQGDTVGDDGGPHAGRTASRSGFIGPDGRELAPFQPDYDAGLTIDPASGTLSAVEIHAAGDATRVTDIDFERVRPQNGLYRVTAPHTLRSITYHTYGFVDRAGRVVVRPTLEDVNDFHEGLAAFATGLDWDIVERAGKASPGR